MWELQAPLGESTEQTTPYCDAANRLWVTRLTLALGLETAGGGAGCRRLRIAHSEHRTIWWIALHQARQSESELRVPERGRGALPSRFARVHNRERCPGEVSLTISTTHFNIPSHMLGVCNVVRGSGENSPQMTSSSSFFFQLLATASES